jgi:hypothetical protein
LRTAAPAQRKNVIASAEDLIAGHQFRFKAGVPGCSCGAAFSDAAGQLALALHANHLAPLLVGHVLLTAAVTLGAQLPAEDAKAAVSVLAGMVRNENAATQRKALEQ